MSKENINYDFHTLLSMLNSKDEENVVLALTSLENTEVLPNIIKTLLLFKESRATHQEWSKHAPSVVAIIKEYLPQFPTVHFTGIMDVASTTGCPMDQIELFVDVVNSHITSELRQAGFVSIKGIETKLHYGE